MHRWTDEEDLKLTEMWNEGVPTRAIQLHFHLGQETIDTARKRLGLVTRASTVWTPEREAEAKRLYVIEGKSATQVARMLGGGLTRNSIIGKAHRANWIRDGRQAASKPAQQPRAPSVPRPKYAKAPKPGPQGKAAVVFGGMKPVLSPEKADEKRAEFAAYGKGILAGFDLPANDDAIPLMDRQRLQCSWPVGTPARPAEQMCCGQPVTPGANATVETYCTRHARAASTGPVDLRSFERGMRRHVA